MSEERKRTAPRPATYIPKSGRSPRYPEVLAQQFDGEDMAINTFAIEAVTEKVGDDDLISHYTTDVREQGSSSKDILQVGDFVCIAEGVQRFVMNEATFRAAYKRKHS